MSQLLQTKSELLHRITDEIAEAREKINAALKLATDLSLLIQQDKIRDENK